METELLKKQLCTEINSTEDIYLLEFFLHFIVDTKNNYNEKVKNGAS